MPRNFKSTGLEFHPYGKMKFVMKISDIYRETLSHFYYLSNIKQKDADTETDTGTMATY